jgi:hypothetical protein
MNTGPIVDRRFRDWRPRGATQSGIPEETVILNRNGSA